MKKTSAYARKHRARQLNPLEKLAHDNTAWLHTLVQCAPYSDETPVFGQLPGSQTAATTAMLMVRQALDSLVSGVGTTDDFDRVNHAMGVSCIRSAQIDGKDIAKNRISPIFIDANRALRRCFDRRKKWGKWQLMAEDVAAITAGVEAYESILTASSPAQMSAASEEHQKWLQSVKAEEL